LEQSVIAAKISKGQQSEPEQAPKALSSSSQAESTVTTTDRVNQLQLQQLQLQLQQQQQQQQQHALSPSSPSAGTNPLPNQGSQYQQELTQPRLSYAYTNDDTGTQRVCIAQE
jgi:hypothetical protein